MVRALVVEDDEDIRRLLVDELEDKGYQVREAADGVIALQSVNEKRPDIIFVDVIMPLMDGFNLISKLRENPETSEIPVVLVTVVNAADAKRKAADLGVKYHLTKPWESWALDFVLEQVLRSGRRGPKQDAKYQVYPPRAAAARNPADRLGE